MNNKSIQYKKKVSRPNGCIVAGEQEVKSKLKGGHWAAMGTPL